MKKFLSVVKTIVVWLVTVVAVAMMVFTVFSTIMFNRNDRNIFGYKMFIVLSDSMKGEFDAGDLVISKKVDTSTLKEGDIITFQSQDEANFGEIITHKIRTVTTDSQGNLGFITYGIANGFDDETIVSSGFVLGQYKLHFPKVGYFFNFLKTTVGYIACIFVPFILLIIAQGVRCIKLFRQYKKEQKAEIDAERAEVAAQRIENEKMMAEMMALRQQLANGTIQQPFAQSAYQPATQQFVQPVAQPIAQPADQPIVQPVAQPIAQPVAQPIAQPVAQSAVAQSIAQPTIQPATQPTVAQPIAQPVAQPSVQTTTRPTIQATTRPIAQPAVADETASEPSDTTNEILAKLGIDLSKYGL